MVVTGSCPATGPRSWWFPAAAGCLHAPGAAVPHRAALRVAAHPPARPEQLARITGPCDGAITSSVLIRPAFARQHIAAIVPCTDLRKSATAPDSADLRQQRATGCHVVGCDLPWRWRLALCAPSTPGAGGQSGRSPLLMSGVQHPGPNIGLISVLYSIYTRSLSCQRIIYHIIQQVNFGLEWSKRILPASFKYLSAKLRYFASRTG
jgi:hypothetical protein